MNIIIKYFLKVSLLNIKVNPAVEFNSQNFNKIMVPSRVRLQTFLNNIAVIFDDKIEVEYFSPLT